jgi:hypothetical protein
MDDINTVINVNRPTGSQAYTTCSGYQPPASSREQGCPVVSHIEKVENYGKKQGF